MSPLNKAEAAYDHATQAPTEETWKQAAVLLFKVRRKVRAVSARGKGRYPAPVAVTTFSDGRTITMSFWSANGRPLDWERAARVTISGYRLLYGKLYERQWHDTGYDESTRRIRERLPLNCVPAIVQIHEKTTGEIYNPGNAPGADQDQDRRKAA